jgi:hypothetical protein
MTIDPDIALSEVDAATPSSAGTASTATPAGTTPDAVAANGAPGTRILPLGPGATVEVYLVSGNVSVRGTDDARLVIRTRDGRRLDDAVTIEATPGRVRIRDAAGDFRLGPIRLSTRRSADLDLEVPRGTALAVRSLSGDIDAARIRGASRWTTASGDLRLAIETGTVAIETMSGDALVTGGGSLAVTARTVSGDMRLTAPMLDGLDLASTSGDVRLEGAMRVGGKHVITSVSGDVHLTTASPVRVETRTVAGDVRSTGPHRTEGGRGRRTVIVGAGSTPIEVRTTSGDISVRALSADGAAIPTPPAAVLPVPVPRPLPAVSPPVALPSAAASGPELGALSTADLRDAARLEVLRALERGEVDVETASQRLEILEEVGPSGFRGWS